MSRLKTLIPAVLALSLGATAIATPALADNDCPPGQRERDNHCLPKGIAKKIDKDAEITIHNGRGDSNYVVVRPGESLRGRDYRIVEDYGRYGLAPAGGDSVYAIVDDQIVQIDRDTLQIVSLIRALN